MASQYPPKKNTAFTLHFTLYKNDGTVVANPGTYTKKVSIDGGGVADIAASVTEHDTTYGHCSVVLSAAEMSGDRIWVYITDNTSGTVPFTCTLYTTENLIDDIKTDTAAILVDTGTDIPTLIAALPTDADVNAACDTAISDATLPTAAQNADAVWDEALSGHVAAGSTGESLNTVEIAADPWLAPLPGSYGTGTAGKMLSDLSLVVGSGNTSVNHNTGGTDALRYVTSLGAGIDNGQIKAYLKTDYDAGDLSDQKGYAETEADGRWSAPMMLDAGFTYTLVFYKQGYYDPTAVEVTI